MKPALLLAFAILPLAAFAGPCAVRPKAAVVVVYRPEARWLQVGGVRQLYRGYLVCATAQVFVAAPYPSAVPDLAPAGMEGAVVAARALRGSDLDQITVRLLDGSLRFLTIQAGCFRVGQQIGFGG